jgi:hypothetical protein
MKIKLTGFISSADSRSFTMIINEYDSIRPTILNMGDAKFTPLRAHRSVKIWMGAKLRKIVTESGQVPYEAMSEMGVFQIECTLEKKNDAINITTSGIPVVAKPRDTRC